MEVRRNKYFLRSRIIVAMNYFYSETDTKCCSEEFFLRIISNLIVTKEYTVEVSLNFQSVIENLGQAVAGDEKLFFFIGKFTRTNDYLNLL